MVEKLDVVKELEVKNHEIYLNKLNMDLDKNYELINLSISNYINISISDVIAVFIEIEGSLLNKEKISNSVQSYFGKFNNEIDKLVKLRFVLLHNKKDCDNYVSYINNDIVNKIGDVYRNSVIELYNDVSDDYTSFEKERLYNYLFDTYYQRFLRWISDTIGSCNLILINSYNESNNRLALINEKTLKQY